MCLVQSGTIAANPRYIPCVNGERRVRERREVVKLFTPDHVHLLLSHLDPLKMNQFHLVESDNEGRLITDVD